ncbi:MAG: hypothetical protein AB1689_09230 [Thermodesulfobacteriota bacterium]
MTTPFHTSATASDVPWKRYPYTIPGTDEAWFSFPRAEGDQGTGANTYFIEAELRDPWLILPRKPLAPGPAFLTDRFHLTVREWDLSVTAEPHVPAPAHEMPIEYWNGPVRLIGQMGGRPASGFGFHERSKLWFRPHELVYALRETLHHLPATGHAGVRPRALANRVWQCDVLLARNDLEGARRYLEHDVAPGIALLGAPARDAAFEVYDALLEAL